MSAPRTAAAIISDMEDDVLAVAELLAGAVLIAGSLDPDECKPLIRVIVVALQKANAVQDEWQAAFAASRRDRRATRPAHDPVLATIEDHRRAYAAWMAIKDEALLQLDDPADVRLSQADDLMEKLTETTPQTPEGLVALVEYLSAYAHRDSDHRAGIPALDVIAEACRRLIPTSNEASS